jgi:hypothetical protein
MNGLTQYTKSTAFHFRWLFMSAEEKYAYLWGKTRKLNGGSDTIRNTFAVPANSRR